MKKKLKSLRFRILVPVIVISLCMVVLLTGIFSRTFTQTTLQQEQEANAAGFAAVSRSVTPLIETSIRAVGTILQDERVSSYARLQYSSLEEVIHARIRCRDYLEAQLKQHDGFYGLLFMRPDGSLFGALPEGYYFYDRAEDNPLPEAVKAQILSAQLGQTLWAGPLSASGLYGFETGSMPRNVMIAAWKSVDVNYGTCYALMLMDDSIFEQLFSALHEEGSTWYLFTSDQVEIYHTGQDTCDSPEGLIRRSNSGRVFRNEHGRPVCTFSMTMPSPAWTIVREVSMENYEQVIRRVLVSIFSLALVVFLVSMAFYHLWLRKFMKQFRALLDGITQMGRGRLEPVAADPFSITEFETMHQEIDRTSLALSQQMETIRQMEHERMEQENLLKEQERIVEELKTAKDIQMSALPHIFPPFPDRREFNLFASMSPARDVGGDFYDFFFIDSDHLCLVIADVSGKGIPGALFMMVSKRIIEDSARPEHNPADILRKTNEALCDNNQASMFVTVWLGILEISTGILTAANAGHEYPALRKDGGSFELFKDRHGFVLGGLESARYKEYELLLKPGDKLFVYTDGVPEATSEGGEMFGTGRMVSTLNTCTDSRPEDVLQAVKSAVDAFVGDAEPFDDLTMMCLEYLGPAPQGSGER